MQAEEQVEAVAAVHPVEHGLALGGDLGHLPRVHRVPVPVQVVAMGIEPDPAAGHAVGVGHRKNLEDDLVAETPGGGVPREQEANRAVARPGAAGLPGVLSKQEPGHLLAGLRYGGVGNGQQQHVPSVGGLAADLAPKLRVAAEAGQQAAKVAVRVGGHVGDPQRAALGPQAQAQANLPLVPLDGVEVLPGFLVVAVDRMGIFSNREGSGPVVVFAHQVHQVDGDLLPGDAVHAEVVPVGLAVAAVLVGLAFRGTAEVGRGDSFHSAQAAAFKIGGNACRQQN